MSRKRVYFSKSNECDPNDARAVHEILNSLDIEVVEFKGGKYDPAIVDDCEYILFLPPKNSLNPGNEGSGDSFYDVGRGQYEQLERFISEQGCDNTYVISAVSNNTVLVDFIELMATHDKDDQNYSNYWGWFNTDEALQDLTEVLGLKKAEKKETCTADKDYELEDDFETMVAQMEKELTKVSLAPPKPEIVWLGTRAVYVSEDGPMLAAAAYLGLI